MAYERTYEREDILATGIRAYEALLGPGERKGSESYFKCRFHDDSKASLRVGQGRKSQRLQWVCDICKGSGGSGGGDIIHLYAKLHGLNDRFDYPKILRGLADLLGMSQDAPMENLPGEQAGGWENDPSITAIYRYEDEASELLFEKCRMQTPSGKTFRQRRPDGQGGWIYKSAGCRRVPYRLPVVLCTKPGDLVMVVEGEKDVDRAEKAGARATTTCDGGGKWDSAWNEYFRDLCVLIVPDHDEIGEKYAQRVSDELRNIAREIRVWRVTKIWHDAPSKTDLSDVLDKFCKGDLALEKSLVAGIWAEAEKVDPIAAQRSALADLGCTYQDAAQVMETDDPPTDFVLAPLLPTSSFGLIAAGPGVGKSTWIRNLAIAVARGEDFCGLKTMQGPVVLLHIEENPAEVRKHLKLLGLQSSDQIIVASVENREKAIPVLEKLVSTFKPVLVAIDPMQEFLGLHDLNDYAECVERLSPVREIARRGGPHILFLHHTSKANAWILGSQAIKGSIDTSLIMKGAGRDIRTLECDKVRIGTIIEPMALLMDPATRKITSGGTAEEAQDKHLCSVAASVIREENRPLSPAQLHAMIGAEMSVLYRALRRDPDRILERQGGRTRVTYAIAGAGMTTSEGPSAAYNDEPRGYETQGFEETF